MDRILHDVDNAHKILQLTSDTLILVDKNGTCLDIDPHSDLWFLQEDRLLGKNLFNLLPDHTFQKLLPDFRRVTQQGITVNRNYRLPLEGGETYYFKCIMQPYDGDKVLCQYRDITARSNVKLQLERTNYELKEIQKSGTNRAMEIFIAREDILLPRIQRNRMHGRRAEHQLSGLLRNHPERRPARREHVDGSQPPRTLKGIHRIPHPAGRTGILYAPAMLPAE